jgi:tetratricopeptide (TPR) repeat protein
MRQLPAIGAQVLLKRESDGTRAQTITKQGGEFSFSGLIAGRYLLVAEKDGYRSAGVPVVASALTAPAPVEMILSDSEPAPMESRPKQGAPTQPMEFADNPSFTVAGVTDWTAAGGHGSDATLRTSEGLNRETLSLKANNAIPSDERAADNSKEAEFRLRAALAAAPASFDLNHQMGEFYLHHGKYAESIPFLKAAFAMKPHDEGNEVALAAACESVGDVMEARQHIEHWLPNSANADVHRVAGEIDEKAGEPLPAVREFERAVQLDPSEQNYFEWGTELLYHRAVWQAKQVFEQGVKAYPNSSRLLTSLGAALFAGALYDEAQVKLCAASDLNPDDPEPYLFMGKIEVTAAHPLECAATHLAKFAQLHPENALAPYFYAMAIWKRHGESMDEETWRQIDTLLTNAITIDPKCSDAYLQLGNLNSLHSEFPKAIAFYTRAIEANPGSSEAHYRLGVAYDRTGDRAKAKQEFALHDQIEKQEAAEVENQRKAIKQFVVDVPNKSVEQRVP